MARSENVRYWRGQHSTIPNNRISGRLMFEEDTGDAFLEYRDQQSGDIIRRQLTDSRKFNISGGVYTGSVVLARQPEEVQQEIELAIEEGTEKAGWSIPHIAATKQYVDNLRADYQEHADNTTIHVGSTDRTRWDNKVDREEGKGLSANDFTDSFKSKLEEITEDANHVEFEAVQDSGVELGTITIDGVVYTIYAPIITDISGNAETATRLEHSVLIDGIEFDGTQNVKHYAICATSGSDAVKQITVSNYTQETAGTVFSIFFQYDDEIPEESEDILQLKVNSSGTEYPVTYRRIQLERGILTQGLYQFAFTGTSYELLSSIDTNTEYEVASDSIDGLMSSEDKQAFDQMQIKLGGIEDNANNYVLPEATDESLGGITVGNNISINQGQISVDYDDVVGALGAVPLLAGDIDDEYLRDLLNDFTGATATSEGISGLVPAPPYGATDFLLCSNGTWVYAPATYDPFGGATATSSGTVGLVPAPSVQYDESGSTIIGTDAEKFLKGDGSWSNVPIPENLESDIATMKSTINSLQTQISELKLRIEYPDAVILDSSYFIISNSSTYLNLYPANNESEFFTAGVDYAFLIPTGYNQSTTMWLVFQFSTAPEFASQEPETNYMRFAWSSLVDDSVTISWRSYKRSTGTKQGTITGYVIK